MARTDVRNETRLQTRTQLGWRSAADLKPGDIVVTKDGRVGRVKSLTPAAGLHTVHNFAVDDHHTYFVGGSESGVLVHNRNSDGSYSTPETENAAKKPSEMTMAEARERLDEYGRVRAAQGDDIDAADHVVYERVIIPDDDDADAKWWHWLVGGEEFRQRNNEAVDIPTYPTLGRNLAELYEALAPGVGYDAIYERQYDTNHIGALMDAVYGAFETVQTIARAEAVRLPPLYREIVNPYNEPRGPILTSSPVAIGPQTFSVSINTSRLPPLSRGNGIQIGRINVESHSAFERLLERQIRQFANEVMPEVTRAELAGELRGARNTRAGLRLHSLTEARMRAWVRANNLGDYVRIEQRIYNPNFQTERLTDSQAKEFRRVDYRYTPTNRVLDLSMSNKDSSRQLRDYSQWLGGRATTVTPSQRLIDQHRLRLQQQRNMRRGR